ncbi:MAG: HD-GYP domain-containing protein, partial [Candidatus Dormibacteria bacterium]
MAPPTEPEDPSWTSRPWLGRGVQAAVVVTPVAVSAGVATVASRLIQRPPDPGGLVFWWVAVSLSSLAALFATERVMRQLLPLAALLKISMIFPDHAPARFALARRNRRPEEVVNRLRLLGKTVKDGDLAAAQTALELTVALSVHDRRTRGHGERVRVLTDMIAEELRLPPRDRARLRWSALLHDIGKLTVSASLLNKPGKPTEMEWRSIRGHPEAGARLIAPMIPWLGQWGLAVEQHHEWYDGSGYPQGLRGNEICLGARIVSVADIYDTITVTRAYRRPVSVASARAELVRVAGSQLDPGIVRAFLNVSVGRLWRVLGVGALINQIPVLNELATTAARVAPSLGNTTALAGAAGALAVGGAGIVPGAINRGSVQMTWAAAAAHSTHSLTTYPGAVPPPALTSHATSGQSGGHGRSGSAPGQSGGHVSSGSAPGQSASHVSSGSGPGQ